MKTKIEVCGKVFVSLDAVQEYQKRLDELYKFHFERSKEAFKDEDFKESYAEVNASIAYNKASTLIYDMIYSLGFSDISEIGKE